MSHHYARTFLETEIGPPTPPISEPAALRQHSTYNKKHRIPTGISREDLTSWVIMPITSTHSAVFTSPMLAERILMHLPSACAVDYPVERRAAILICPDVRIDRTMRAMFDRAGARIAGYGEQIKLPVADSDCPMRWLRTPREPAYFARLSEISATLRWMGANGHPGRLATRGTLG